MKETLTCDGSYTGDRCLHAQLSSEAIRLKWIVADPPCLPNGRNASLIVESLFLAPVLLKIAIFFNDYVVSLSCWCCDVPN